MSRLIREDKSFLYDDHDYGQRCATSGPGRGFGIANCIQYTKGYHDIAAYTSDLQ